MAQTCSPANVQSVSVGGIGKLLCACPEQLRNRVVGVSVQRWPQSRPSTTQQLSDGRPPDVYDKTRTQDERPVSIKSLISQIWLFRASLGLGGALCLWLRHGSFFVVRGAHNPIHNTYFNQMQQFIDWGQKCGHSDIFR